MVGDTRKVQGTARRGADDGHGDVLKYATKQIITFRSFIIRARIKSRLITHLGFMLIAFIISLLGGACEMLNFI